MRAGLLLAALAIGLAGCGDVPPAGKTPEKKTAANPPQMLPPPPTVPADAYANVAAAMAEVEAANRSGQAEDQQKLVRVEIWLTNQGGKIQPELTALIKDDAAGEPTRVAALRTLAKLGPSATPIIMEATSSQTKRVRLKAIESLGRIKPPTKEIVEKLIGILDQTDFEDRKAALAGLTAIGPAAKTAVPSIVEKLTGLLNNLKEEDTLRTAAHKALKEVDPRRKLQN